MYETDATDVEPTISSRAAPLNGVRTGVTDKSEVRDRSNSPDVRRSPAELIALTQRFADDIASRPNLGSVAAPVLELQRMGELGLLMAPLPASYGGMGLGTEAGGHLPLLRLLAMIGGADLALGRLYEGHVNALILIAAYGSAAQLKKAAEDARRGHIFGVWNTGAQELLSLEGGPETYSYRGTKTFATGAAFVMRPIVTARLPEGGWQMTLPPMESSAVAKRIRLDRSFWHPLGMESSESYGIDFTGAAISKSDFIGEPESFYRDPLFRGGAIRFAAVHAGAILRLHRLFAEWLQQQRRDDDPYQVARLGEVALSAQEAVLWIERAAATAEDCLAPGAGKSAIERMLECANMTRVAIERLATVTMQRVVAGVGAHGLLQPNPIERIVRDLTMYLRQPAPDQALAGIGRASLRKASLREDGAGNGFWLSQPADGSLPPTYFENVYAQSSDPWSFSSSDYEAAKYRETLASLPLPRYRNALEIGCSIGVFTAKLAERCDNLLGIDVAEKALALARERCSALPQVQLLRMRMPDEAPDGIFDLIVLSEVGYYWQSSDVERVATLVAERQPAGGHLVLVHYTPPVPDYPLTGDEVHEIWLSRPEWRRIQHARHSQYRLDVLERNPSLVIPVEP